MEIINGSELVQQWMNDSDTTNATTQAVFRPAFSCDTFKPAIYRMSVAQFKEHIKFVVNVYKTLPVIGTLSILFNLFNILIWTRKQNSKFSSSYYIIALAISDIGLGYTYLIRGLDLYFLYDIKAYRDISQSTLRINNTYLPYVFSMINFWITAAVAVERAICVTLPTKSRSICTVRKAKWISSMIVLVPFLIHIPNIYVYDMFITKLPCGIGYSPIFTKTKFGSSRYTDKLVYLLINLILQILIPYGITVIANMQLVVSLMKASKTRRKLTGGMADDYSKDVAAARMIIAITLTFVVLNIPYVIYSYYGSTNANDGFRFTLGFFTLIYVDRILTGCNQLVNLIAYSLLSSNFRATVKKLFCSDKKKSPYLSPYLSDSGKTLSSDVSVSNTQTTIKTDSSEQIVNVHV